MEKPEEMITTIKVVTKLMDDGNFKVTTTSTGAIPLSQRDLNILGILALRLGQANEVVEGLGNLTPDDLFPPLGP